MPPVAHDILGSVIDAAMTAKAVSFARPYLYGLAAGGQRGVERALDLFVSGLERDMILLGVKSIDALDESFIEMRR